MDLNKEAAQLKESFRTGGILTRTCLILGFIFSVSSITSLSSTVIQWKGFILDALNFYHLYFVSPISSTASAVGLHYSRNEIHAATASSICLTVGMRILAAGQKAAFREINAKYNSQLKPSMAIQWLIGATFPVGIWVWYGVSDAVIRPWLFVFVAATYPAFIILPKFIMSKFGWVIYEEKHFSYIKSYYAYMAAIFLIIGTLAAINAGLQEEKPDKSLQPTTKISFIEKRYGSIIVCT